MGGSDLMPPGLVFYGAPLPLLSTRRLWTKKNALCANWESSKSRILAVWQMLPDLSFDGKRQQSGGISISSKLGKKTRRNSSPRLSLQFHAGCGRGDSSRRPMSCVDLPKYHENQSHGGRDGRTMQMHFGNRGCLRSLNENGSGRRLLFGWRDPPDLRAVFAPRQTGQPVKRTTKGRPCT